MIDARDHLAELCGGLLPGEVQELRTFYRGGERDGKPGPRWFGTDPDEALEEIATWPKGLDQYFAPNPRRRSPAGQPQTGKKVDVARIRYLYADLDNKHFPDGATGAAAALAAFPLPPTWVTRTGGGFQPVWAIDPLIITGPEDPQIVAVEGVQARMYAALGGLDPVQDISRVLRRVGSHNHKYPDVPEVVVRHHDPDARYTFEEFAALLPAPAPTAAPRRPYVPTHDDPTADELREMLHYVNPQPGYAEWVRVLAAIHSVYPGPDGEAIAEEWSPGDERNSVAAKFKSFGRYRGARGPATIGTIVYLARHGGWRPLPKAAPTFVVTDEDDEPEEVVGAREAALVRENAELRAALIEERDARAQDRAVHRKVMATLKVPHLSASERLTAIALALEVAPRRRAGEADEQGGVVIRGYKLAEKTAQSVDTCRKHLNTFAEMGIIGKETRAGGRATFTDPITGYEVTKPVSETIVVTQGETVIDILDNFLVAERPAPRNHGGKREPCPRCGSQRRKTTVTCAACDLILSQTISEPPADEEMAAEVSPRQGEPASVPPTPVIVPLPALTYPEGPVRYQATAAGPVKVDEREDPDDEADDWDPYECNHAGCKSRPVIGQRYCGFHRAERRRAVEREAVAASADPSKLDPEIAVDLARKHDREDIARRLDGFRERWEGGERTPLLKASIADWETIRAARALLDGPIRSTAGGER